MLQAKPGATPEHINTSLENTAIDMAAAGFDYDSGFGLIQADAAITEVLNTSVNAAPVAAFTYACTGTGCSFNSSGSSDDVGITGYTWDFGDGNGSIEQNASHTYAAQGNYTVTLVVEDAESENDTASATFRVKRKGGSSGSSGGGEDGDGSTLEPEKGRKKCSDGIDNDGDGFIDGADTDCS